MSFALPQIGQAWLNPAVAGLILLCGGRVPAQELATGPPNGTVLTPVRCYGNDDALDLAQRFLGQAAEADSNRNK